MSKIGRKPIPLNGVSITVENNIITYKGKESSGSYSVPADFTIIRDEDGSIVLSPVEAARERKDINMIWGLHRALLNNAVAGAGKLFEKQLKIEGLGFKAEQQGSLIVFSLGFSHKINYTIPAGVSIEIDKTKQNIILKSAKKDLVGHVASVIRGFKPVEPYKGKGISYSNEVVLRKAGKTK